MLSQYLGPKGILSPEHVFGRITIPGATGLGVDDIKKHLQEGDK